MIDYLNTYGILKNSFMQYIYFAGILLITFVVAKIAFSLFKGVVRKATSKTKSVIDDVIVDAVEEPVVLGIVIIGLYFALNFLTLPDYAWRWAGNILKVLVFIDIIWLVSRSVSDILEHVVKPFVEKSQPELGGHFLFLVKRAVSIVIWVVGIMFIISNMGFDISTLIAGLGIGGVAIALAVKDIISNVFGGVTVVTDMPFKVGDRIRVSGIDGTVTELGVRTTRIKSLDGTQYIVPNSKMTDSIIENVSREKARKMKMTLGVEYSTSNAKMKKAKKIIEDIVLKNKHTDDKSLVYFTGFGDFALNILVIYYIKNLNEILPTMHEVNMQIKEKFEKAGIEFAYPTQTIHLKK